MSANGEESHALGAGPAGLRAVRYALRLRAREALRLPAYKGSAFRGAFGHAFKRLACTQGLIPCEGCMLRATCPYPLVFESFPPPGADRLRNLQDVPRPFVIEPPRDDATEYAPGSRLDFGLVLVGRAVDFLPHFVLTFREAGRRGIGPGRGAFELESVHAEGEETPVFREGDQVIRPPAGVPRDGWAARAASIAARLRPGASLEVEFTTHVRLVERGEVVRAGPPFRVLMRAALARLSALLYFHHGVELAVDFRGLLEAAGAVPVLAAETRWVDWSRYSARQEASMNLGGLVGRVRYGGGERLRPFLPFLAAAEVVHVGKNATFGLGRFRMRVGGEP
jgi:hypothetical protein